MDAVSVARGREIALAGGEALGVRKAIVDSWLRSRHQGLRPDHDLPPILYSEDKIDEIRRQHVLAQVWPLLADTLRWAASEPGNLLCLGDAEGHLLWTEGLRPTLSAAERSHLMPGALWSEEAAGTNGIGTALTLQRPLQVSGFEHYLSAATGFTCTAVPIRDPANGEPLGLIDLTSDAKSSAPMALSLLVTAARLAEAELRMISLRRQAKLRDRYAERLSRLSGTRSALVTAEGHVLHAEPTGWLTAWHGALAEGRLVLPSGRSVMAERLSPGGPFLLIEQDTGSDQILRFEALGRDRARLHVTGTTHDLSRRHSEILAVLLANPGGISADDLRHEVYGRDGKAVTLRAELTRVRSLLGHRLAAEPYRLTGECDADFLRLDTDLATGEATGLGEVLDRYPGPLLPSSSAPGVAVLRERLHERLRRRLLEGGDADNMSRWLTARHGRDDRKVRRALTLREAARPGDGAAVAASPPRQGTG
ncbi:helix-turn-helix domain-containing protein [Actinomadura sp. HBU206391]|uniref:helix-turn-helix domain-containing protein n=1 Tax=Actinomadura sp. HBU206391 TaxID=2731692 RepID=UPI00164F5FB4|nr:helix-turn-helix domain-containing protein [Actinomadura sp. HBU206391]MBC6461363.1 GAF domain-containing protein [Actinomadura sp. HBU206391]